ncbi:hypothetical protein A2U01_0022241 [Trifolium medium]|uniref:Uncharacterized protein n=1 Tax=Trifolium medium TaxID=97028 RepID=A0A392NQ56_9FABA|nr:hypothetical protein [Trifolium medium]
MAETTVPETGSKTNKVRGRGNWVEIAEAITSHERIPCLKVKYRETKWIKGNRNIIVVRCRIRQEITFGCRCMGRSSGVYMYHVLFEGVRDMGYGA